MEHKRISKLLSSPTEGPHLLNISSLGPLKGMQYFTTAFKLKQLCDNSKQENLRVDISNVPEFTIPDESVLRALSGPVPVTALGLVFARSK